jgi:hypothetical protein
MPFRCFGRLPSTLLALAVSSGAREAQEERYPEHSAAATAPTDDPGQALEFALGDDGLAFGYRNGLHRGKGYWSLGLFAGQDDDFALSGRLMRFGEPRGQSAFGFGVGLGLFAAAIDATDDEVGAITLTGAADFAFDEWFVLDYPIRIGVEVSVAPDEATFVDGERVVDALGRIELDLSPWATVFGGYRYLELGFEDEEDLELDRGFHAGVRLGF